MTSQLLTLGESFLAPIVDTLGRLDALAGPRVPYSPDTYKGAELSQAPARAGATDAMALPSLFNGRRVHTSGRVEQITPPPARVVAAAAAPDRRRSAVTYEPKPGTFPARVLAHLKEHGGHLTYPDLTARFGIPRTSVSAVFGKALDSGALVRIRVEKCSAFALPAS